MIKRIYEKLQIDRRIQSFKHVKPVEKIVTSRVTERIGTFIFDYWLLCFFISLFVYLEMLYRLWIFKGFSVDYFFSFLFSFSAGAMVYLLTSLLPQKAAGAASVVLTFLTSLAYGIQLIYTCIFQTPLSLVSIGGAGDALQFQDIIIESILKNAVAVILLFVPVALLFIRSSKLAYTRKKPLSLAYVLLFCITSYCVALICVNLTGDSPSSQYTLYYEPSSPELTVDKLGVLTATRLDLERIVAQALDNKGPDVAAAGAFTHGGDGETPDNNTVAIQPEDTGSSDQSEPDETNPLDAQSVIGEPEESEEETVPKKPYNTMDIDFETLLASGQEDQYAAMHKYFSTVQPTATNEYTGMFEGCNLIMLTAEGFSPYVISEELTPTLYKMSTEGFVFNNFYNPVWWVSTSDGEYVACTGLIPKSGVWSFAYSGKNYMPFGLGNQFRKLGYTTKAYHNHTYTYYKRDISHPNMGYDYKGVGNGLEVKKTWPESDLEMIDVTADEYIGQEPFHTYYMTVSGHMNYTFGGNQMARKNKEYVKDLPYSEEAKAYIACNLELEFALSSLMQKLEEAGIAENTVIVLSADHYPYGLAKEKIDELAGHEVEKNFELYKSTFILYKAGMEPVIIDKPCTSLDILPTISNLFGLEYDSRLLMGSDILSDSPALAIFSNRSWITDRAVYNSAKNSVKFTDGTTEDKEYVQKVNKIVANKFSYSSKILENDYYRKVIP